MNEMFKNRFNTSCKKDNISNLYKNLNIVQIINIESSMAQLTLMLRRAKRNNQKKIDLSSREISFIPNDVYGLTKIEILNLSNNRITSIDEKIKQLKELKVLDLSGNSIMDLPREILSLSNLQALIMDGNPLMKQFEPLLQENASSNLKKILNVCFGLESADSLDTPSWLNETKPELQSSKAFGKMVEIENQYKNQQERVKQLQRQIQKLSLKSKLSSSKQGFNLDVDSLLEINYKDLQVHDQISMGGFSTIHSGVYKGLDVAIKKIFNPKINQELMEQFNNQINMLAKFRHPSIVLLIGISSVPPNLAIVTQFIKNGSLYDQLHKRKSKYSPKDRRRIVVQILSAIHYLHEHGIVHRDIKSHNFLVDQYLNVKLCDFGLARSRSKLNQGPMQFSGTPVYMAQQLFQKKSYDESVDIFALGTLLFQIYTGQIPHNGLDPASIKEKLLKDSNLNHHSLDNPILQLINRCRNANTSSRPTSGQLLNFQGLVIDRSITMMK